VLPPRKGIHLQLSALDLPFVMANEGSWPSMLQSKELSADVYSLVHLGIARGFRAWGGEWYHHLLSRFAIAAADIGLLYLPGGMAWQHEEWHRAVLSHHDFDSYNEVYEFELFSEAIAVSHVADRDLIRLKRFHPADHVRMSTAGIEANYELATHMEKLAFFERTETFDLVLLWMLNLSNIFYMGACSDGSGDELIDDMNAEEGADMDARDFTGMDCTAWTYDLFRPGEPYEARGPHPYGPGINRYRKLSHLTGEEKDYLEQQFWLSWLNLVDPQLLGLREFEVSNPFSGRRMLLNASLRHQPAPFGYVLSGQFFFLQPPVKVFVGVHRYVNHERSFPGLEVQLLRLPVQLTGGHPLSLSARAVVWMQPDDQYFFADSGEPGALGSVRLGLPLADKLGVEAVRALEPFVEMQAKTEGWVPGEVSLLPSFELRAGVEASVF